MSTDHGRSGGRAGLGRAAAVVEVADDAEGDRWKAMADAFDFGGLSDDDGRRVLGRRPGRFVARPT
jgi:hypothetical protein